MGDDSSLTLVVTTDVFGDPVVADDQGGVSRSWASAGAPTLELALYKYTMALREAYAQAFRSPHKEDRRRAWEMGEWLGDGE